MDLIIKKALDDEMLRQENSIELIASENYVSAAVLQLQGSILTNKYAEGYPHKRYYGGCEHVDVIEKQAIFYAKCLFDCKYANVQPHSGSSANMAVYKALLNIGDKIMGMNLCHGGHLSHGYPLNFSGKEYNIISYSVDLDTGMIDYDEIKKIALKEKPKLIIAGASAYSRIIDFKKFREIADLCGAYLMVDMAHIAGLVAAFLHPNPVIYADVVTSTTHKTLRGPRGGLILTNNKEIANKIDKTIFPGIQGGPLMHIIAAKAQAFYEALKPEFVLYQKQVIKNASALACSLQEEGFHIVSNITENHLMLVDVSVANISGDEASKILDKINITVNKNVLPTKEESCFYKTGIRLGSPAMTTRGLKEEDFILVGKIIARCLKNKDDDSVLFSLREEVLMLTKKFPLYGGA